MVGAKSKSVLLDAFSFGVSAVCSRGLSPFRKHRRASAYDARPWFFELPRAFYGCSPFVLGEPASVRSLRVRRSASGRLRTLPRASNQASSEQKSPLLTRGRDSTQAKI